MNAKVIPDNVKGLECRHVTYCVNNDTRVDDLLVIKEYVHYKDGTRKPRIRLRHNVEQDFWVTREKYRTHTDQLEWEDEERLKKYSSTRVGLPRAVARALNYRGHNMSLRHIAKSPYVYGFDIETTSLEKVRYQKRFPDCISPLAEVAVLDIETDMTGEKHLNMISLTFKNRAVICITKAFMDGIDDPVAAVHAKAHELIGPLLEKRQVQLEVKLLDTPGACVAYVMQRAHEWKPDFITVWNINFDLPKIVRELEDENYNLGDVFSDPAVPRPYRFFKYVEGLKIKKTQDGSEMPIHPADQWHVATCPASFYFLDAMCLYKRIRVAGGNEPSYALDAIMKKHLNLGKLKFTATDHLSKGEWHKVMQRNYKVEYAVYNIFDCIGLELLDEKTGDVCSAFSVLAGVSDFKNFAKNPRRIVDDLHYICRDIGKVISTTPDNLKEDYDKYVVGLENWIITLASYKIDDNGVELFTDMPWIKSMLRAHCGDLDIEGTYPRIQCILNISKETTYREVGQVQGMTESQRREIGINLTGGSANAIQIAVDAFKLPTPYEMLAAFEADCC